MRKIIFALAFAGAVESTGSPTAAVDECTYNFSAAISALDANSKEFKSVHKINRNEKEKYLTQSATFKNGTKVIYTTGGCAHLSYSYTYKNLKQKTFTADQAFKKAIELLEKTPTIDNSTANKEDLIASLKSAAMNKIFRPPNQNYEIPCGDAQCNLDASKKNQLTISYSFAL
jgi:hypothetical protein